MGFCTNCGSTVAEEAKFCVRCGIPVASKTIAATAGGVTATAVLIVQEPGCGAGCRGPDGVPGLIPKNVPVVTRGPGT